MRNTTFFIILWIQFYLFLELYEEYGLLNQISTSKVQKRPYQAQNGWNCKPAVLCLMFIILNMINYGCFVLDILLDSGMTAVFHTFSKQKIEMN